MHSLSACQSKSDPPGLRPKTHEGGAFWVALRVRSVVFVRKLPGGDLQESVGRSPLRLIMPAQRKSLAIMPSRNGHGLFALRPLKEGDAVLSIRGRIVSVAEIDHKGGKIESNSYRVGRNYYVNPGRNLSGYLNHSCAPNCGLRKIGRNLVVTALRGINEGEEVLIDYSTIMGDDDPWRMICNCGCTECRRLVGPFSSLPSTLKARYRRLGIVPQYILDLCE